MNTTPTHTAKSVAEHLRVSASTVYRWLKNGEIVKHGYTGQKIKNRWVITPVQPTHKPVEVRIHEAYAASARTSPGGMWCKLTELRTHLTDLPREPVDETLGRMLTQGQVHLEPEVNRHRLTDDDHAAAIYLGGEDRHLFGIYR